MPVSPDKSGIFENSYEEELRKTKAYLIVAELMDQAIQAIKAHSYEINLSLHMNPSSISDEVKELLKSDYTKAGWTEVNFGSTCLGRFTDYVYFRVSK